MKDPNTVKRLIEAGQRAKKKGMPEDDWHSLTEEEKLYDEDPGKY